MCPNCECESCEAERNPEPIKWPTKKQLAKMPDLERLTWETMKSLQRMRDEQLIEDVKTSDDLMKLFKAGERISFNVR